MSLWRSMRDGAAGTWRAVRGDPGSGADPERDQFDLLYPEYDAYEQERQPRRLLAVAVVGLVLAGGVAGVYFAVAGGLGALLVGAPAGPVRAPSAPVTRSSAPCCAASTGGLVVAPTPPAPGASQRPASARRAGRPGPAAGGPSRCVCPTPSPALGNSPSPLSSPSVAARSMTPSLSPSAEHS